MKTASIARGMAIQTPTVKTLGELAAKLHTTPKLQKQLNDRRVRLETMNQLDQAKNAVAKGRNESAIELLTLCIQRLSS